MIFFANRSNVAVLKTHVIKSLAIRSNKRRKSRERANLASLQMRDWCKFSAVHPTGVQEMYNNASGKKHRFSKFFIFY